MLRLRRNIALDKGQKKKHGGTLLNIPSRTLLTSQHSARRGTLREHRGAKATKVPSAPCARELTIFVVSRGLVRLSGGWRTSERRGLTPGRGRGAFSDESCGHAGRCWGAPATGRVERSRDRTVGRGAEPTAHPTKERCTMVRRPASSRAKKRGAPLQKWSRRRNGWRGAAL